MDRKRVMIIDDDAETLTLMVRQLEAIFEVRGFTSGEEALNTLKLGFPGEGGVAP